MLQQWRNIRSSSTVATPGLVRVPPADVRSCVSCCPGRQVLNLGFLMTSYFKWTGLTEAEVSVYRGIGALVGRGSGGAGAGHDRQGLRGGLGQLASSAHTGGQRAPCCASLSGYRAWVATPARAACLRCAVQTGLAATFIFPPLSARAGLTFCAAAGITWQLVSYEQPSRASAPVMPLGCLHASASARPHECSALPVSSGARLHGAALPRFSPAINPPARPTLQSTHASHAPLLARSARTPAPRQSPRLSSQGFLAAGVLPVAVPLLGSAGLKPPAQGAVRSLVAGVVGSRTGLWLFDLAVTQLIQETVPAENMGEQRGWDWTAQQVCVGSAAGSCTRAHVGLQAVRLGGGMAGGDTHAAFLGPPFTPQARSTACKTACRCDPGRAHALACRPSMHQALSTAICTCQLQPASMFRPSFVRCTAPCSRPAHSPQPMAPFASAGRV